MLREIYFRNSSDTKYDGSVETNSKVEAVLNKIRMILGTNRGEVLGSPDLGMNQENYLFEYGFDQQEFRTKFNAQVVEYIPENKEFEISIDFSMETDGVKNFVYVYILINNVVQMGIII